MEHTVRSIQSRIAGELSGNPETLIGGVNALELAGPGELTFAESQKYAQQVRQSRASAFIVPHAFPAIDDRVFIRVEDPRLAFINIMHLFQRETGLEGNIHPCAVVAPDAELGERVTIRECAVVRSGAKIGRASVIESGAHIGEGVVLGEACFIGPNVVVMYGSQLGNRVIVHGGTVIGADGFGYVWTEGRHMKIPQLGNVVIGDDVELGANVCVDRATFGSTVIKRGTKVDNQVQIAHNDIIGEHVIMAGQTGLAGSVKVGNRVLFGGQCGVKDHVVIGDDARLGAASIVIRNVPAGQTVWWYPARPIEKIKQELAALGILPRVIKELRQSRRPGRRSPRKTTRK